ncbi:MAG: PAS domain S-box protein [Chitinophagaceae bacterium]|nr:MAG: PAS domain S-box protein [Chitinophagaceae bacterium]
MYVCDNDKLWERIMDFSNLPGRQDPHSSTNDTSAQRGGEPGSAWLAENRLKRVISIDTAGVIYYNTDGTILFANEAFAGMSGYTYEQLASGTIRLDHITAPGSLNATGTEQQPGDTGHRAPCEQQYVRPDGSSWWGMFAGSCQDNDDECVGLIIDITDMKMAQQALGQSEARFRTFSDALPQVIWTNDGEGKADYFNAKWYDYSGLSYEESFGIGWEAIVHPDDRAVSTERWKSALVTGTAFETEYRLQRKDGVYRWHLARNVPLKDDAGKVTAWFGSATDIDAMKVSEYLNHQFIGVASHELKTPVTSIKAMTELVYEQLEAEKNHGLAPVVAKINGQVDRLSRLISDLLDTTRLEEGYMPLVLGEFHCHKRLTSA